MTTPISRGNQFYQSADGNGSKAAPWLPVFSPRDAAGESFLQAKPFFVSTSIVVVGETYGAGDVATAAQAALFALPNLFPAGGGIALLSELAVTIPVASLTGRIRLHFYPQNIKIPTADNGAYALDPAFYAGSRHVDLPGLQVLVASASSWTNGSQLGRFIRSGSRDANFELQFLESTALGSGNKTIYLEAAGLVWGVSP